MTGQPVTPHPAEADSTQSTWRSSGILTGAVLLGTLASIGTNVLLVVTLEPDAFGLVAVLIALPTILLVISNFGLHTAGLYYIAKVPGKARSITTVLSLYSVVMASVLFLLGSLSLPLWAGYFAPAPSLLLRLSLSTILPQMLILFYADLSIGLAITWLAALLRILPGGLNAVIVLGLLIAGRLTLWSAMLAWITALFVSAVLAWAILAMKRLFTLRIEPGIFRAMLGYGTVTHIGDTAQYLVYRIDLPMIGLLGTYSAAGLYSVATRLAELLWLPAATMRSVVLSEVAGGDQSGAFTAAYVRVASGVGAIAAVALGLLAIPLFRLILPEYGPSLVLTWILIPGTLAASLYRVIFGDLIAHGRAWLGSLIAVAGLALSLTLYIMLIPRFGAGGAASASTVTYILQCGVVIGILKKGTGRRWSEYFLPRRDDMQIISRTVMDLWKRLRGIGEA